MCVMEMGTETETQRKEDVKTHGDKIDTCHLRAALGYWQTGEQQPE